MFITSPVVQALPSSEVASLSPCQCSPWGRAGSIGHTQTAHQERHHPDSQHSSSSVGTLLQLGNSLSSPGLDCGFSLHQLWWICTVLHGEPHGPEGILRSKTNAKDVFNIQSLVQYNTASGTTLSSNIKILLERGVYRFIILPNICVFFFIRYWCMQLSFYVSWQLLHISLQLP